MNCFTHAKFCLVSNSAEDEDDDEDGDDDDDDDDNDDDDDGVDADDVLAFSCRRLPFSTPGHKRYANNCNNHRVNHDHGRMATVINGLLN
jgi:hypothetical protein